MWVIGFPEYLPQAERLAGQLAMPLRMADVHRFPDGESLVRLPPVLPRTVIFYRSLNQPNDKLIELLLCAETAKEMGADRLILVAPYLCYMRQDIASRPGEAVSQQIIGKMLAGLFDDVITVDAHLHRIDRLDEAIPSVNAINVSAVDAIADFLISKFKHAILLGPDSESAQWVSGIADRTNFDYAIAEKVRSGDKHVSITLPDKNFKQHPVVVIDDMASTGRTLAQTISLLHKAGAKDVYAVITHALFCGDAEVHIRSAGVKAIWSTDSIQHPTSCINLDGLLSATLQSIL
jgi:ribose-phosphate pyrophosphokinase